MSSYAPFLDGCGGNMQDVIAVMAVMPKNLANISLHITAYYYTYSVIEPIVLARVMDHQVLPKVHLRDTFEEGAYVRYPITSILWRLLVGRAGDTGPSRSVIAEASATAPVVTTTIAPEQN